MDTPRLLLVLSTLAFVSGVIHAFVVLRAGGWKESRWHLAPMALGFLFQSGFLYLRGQQDGRCPITSLYEVLIFIGWSIVLLYFLVGPAYRLSLLGVFTAPLVASLQIAALASRFDTLKPPPLRHGPGSDTALLELHASIALIAYAAFALACVTGVMFLLQDYLLKRHRVHALFHQLPPIQSLGKAIFRMVLLGVLLLSGALALTFGIHLPVTNAKLLLAWLVWGAYLVILILMWRRTLTARQTAWLAVVGYAIPMATLWIVTGAP